MMLRLCLILWSLVGCRLVGFAKQGCTTCLEGSGGAVSLPGFILAGGHLIEAAYVANKREPGNVQVRVSIAADARLHNR